MSRLVVIAEVAHQIARGVVTMHRRPVDGRRPRVVRRLHIGGASAHVSKAWQPSDGERMTVHRSRDNELICHVELLAHRRERHGSPTSADLVAHGHRNLAAHARAWLQQYDGDWLWEATAARRGPADTLTSATLLLTDDQAAERFRRRWADRQVWVLSFRVVEAPDVHLAPSGRQRGADEHGHTLSESASIGAGALQPVDELNPGWARAALSRHERDRPSRRRRVP